ncbi:hypothetical protein A3850_011150 [Lewinella sp. 4G2]|nr:hypothetical protein A3850_011150 [Lewinella sp. 4G2]
MLFALLLTVISWSQQADLPVQWVGNKDVVLGTIPRGEDHTITYQFRNLTDGPLLIENVRTSCGCTSSDWEERPVAPDSFGSINVTYDSTKRGYFRKNVKVFFVGHRGGHRLSLSGFVE